MSLSQVCGFIATIRSTPPRRPSQPISDTRTSYHVGRPWMFDGKMLRGLTGTPMRRIDLAKRVFADAEPEPLTLANLMTKSLTASRFIGPLPPVAGGPHLFGANVWSPWDRGSSDAESLTREERRGTLGEAGNGGCLMLRKRGGLVEAETPHQIEQPARLLLELHGRVRRALHRRGVGLRGALELSQRAVDALDARGLLARGDRDHADQLVHLLDLAGDVVDDLARRVHQPRSGRDIGHRIADERLDLPGRLGAAAREIAHLLCHDGEAPALLARARGFDRGVERED